LNFAWWAALARFGLALVVVVDERICTLNNRTCTFAWSFAKAIKTF